MEGLLIVTALGIMYGAYILVVKIQDKLSDAKVKRILESRKG
jgi:alpha-ketoglutarate-dependent taurine dioxygenase